MSKKNKSTPNAKVLTVLLIVLFVGACVCLVIAFCTGKIGKDIETLSLETTSSVPETTVSSETSAATSAEALSETSSVATTASEASISSLELGTNYKVDYWVEYYDEHGTAGLGVLFGASNTGAEVSFDGERFVISASGYGELSKIATGTFSFVSDNEIELRYDNSNITTAKVVETENGVVTSLDIPLDIEGTTLRASISQ